MTAKASEIEIGEHFNPLFLEDRRFFVLWGGRGSGKSFVLSLFLLYLTYEEGHVILFTRYTMRSARISIIPEFLSKIKLMGAKKHFTVTKDEVLNNITGSRIIFRGIKTSEGVQTANLKSIEGLTTWVLDEAEELHSEEVFDTIAYSVRQKGKQNRIILALNPSRKKHFIYQRFFANRSSDASLIYSNYLMNKKNLNSSFIEDANKLKAKNPKKYTHVLLGQWLDDSEGRVFDYSICTKAEYDALQKQEVFGVDFGFTDPFAMVGAKAVGNKLYIHEYAYVSGLTASQQRNIVVSHAKANKVIADSARPELIAEIAQRGINIVPCKKHAGSVLASIRALQDFEIIVTEESSKLIKELDGYYWQVDALGNVLNTDKDFEEPSGDNHAIDALRYLVYDARKPATNSLPSKPSVKIKDTRLKTYSKARR